MSVVGHFWKIRPVVARYWQCTSEALASSAVKMSTQTDSCNQEIRSLLRENSTQKYFIEYIGFMSNHMSHGLYALEQLKAPTSKAHSFINLHGTKKLEDAETHRKREMEEPRPDDISELIGARKSFYYLYESYQKLLKEKYGGSLEELIAGEFPKISSGMVGSAVHGLIHTGYGYASKESWFVCEGLAYLHHSNCPPLFTKDAPDLTTLGSGTYQILDVIDLVRKDSKLISFISEAIKLPEMTKLNTSDFQRKTRVLFHDRADALGKYVHMIEFPKGLAAKDLTKAQFPAMAKWLVDCAITVYAIAENPNDFFLIHGVTGGWSLKNLLPLLENPTDVLTATRAFLCTLLATYLAQNHPGLKRELLSDKSALEHSWETLAQRAILQDKHEEEHIFKLVQVCKMMSEEYQDPAMEHIYRMAAVHSVQYPLTF